MAAGASRERPADRLPEVGEMVVSGINSDLVFTLLEVIGEGGYGSVFRVACRGSKRLLALKAEKFSKTVLKNEIAVLKSAGALKCQHICELIDHGRVDREYMYIVITLLGPDLYKMRREMLNQHFSLSTSMRSAIQTLKGLEELHTCGYLSRDVKPSNFAIGRREDNRGRIVYFFDFGLAKRFVDKNFNLLPSRGAIGWRGTARYGSLSAHVKQDLGRKDDVESWFYMVVEFANGSLPWRFLHDRSEVQSSKKEARAEARSRFLDLCPKQFDVILSEIDKLHFTSQPPYSLFYEKINEVLQSRGIGEDDPLDWEIAEESTSRLSRTETGERSTQIPMSSENREASQ